jgi:hypothetical protein
MESYNLLVGCTTLPYSSKGFFCHSKSFLIKGTIYLASTTPMEGYLLFLLRGFSVSRSFLREAYLKFALRIGGRVVLRLWIMLCIAFCILFEIILSLTQLLEKRDKKN